ncbi:hypothetical protein MYO4S_00027 [Serratia phage 4S]|nr:hypothetical protein MYO4S_00027 [Serratia phage 4S]
MSLNIAGCPAKTRFMVFKKLKLDYYRCKIVTIHTYVGVIELDMMYDTLKEHNVRVYPIPATVVNDVEPISQPELSVVELWQEALTLEELIEYLD